MTANTRKSAPPPIRDKAERQALYLAYRAMPAHPESGKRMTQTAAAKLAGVDSSTVTRWKREDEQFRARESEVRREGIGRVTEQAKAGAAALLPTAIYTMAQIIRDKEANEHVRAQIAIKLMEWCGAGQPLQIEIGGDPWGAVLQELARVGTDE